MVYLKNNTDKQQCWIPRDEAPDVVYPSGPSYDSGFTDGRNYQKSLLSSATFTDNGDYARANGWSSVTVNVATGESYQQGYEDGYASGHTQGMEDRESQMVDLIATANNMTYSAESGYKTVRTQINMSGGFVSTATTNGHFEYDAYDFGVAGWEHITLDVEVPQTGITGTEISLSAVTQEVVITDYDIYHFEYNQMSPTKKLTIIFTNGSITGDTGIVTAVYDVVETSGETQILNIISFDGTSRVLSMSVDGGEETVPATGYTFNTTGEHTIVFKTSNNAIRSLLFWGCDRLRSITLEDVVIINNEAFGKTGITGITFNNGIYQIKGSAFSYCTNLTQLNNFNAQELGAYCFGWSGIQSFTVPSNIDVLPVGFFACCYDLTSVDLGSVRRIENSALSLCTGLTSVNIPATVESIESNAFQRCRSLNSIYVLNENPPAMGEDVFNGVASAGTAYFTVEADMDVCRQWVADNLPENWTASHFLE